VTEFDHTPTELPDQEPGRGTADPSVNQVPGEPDDVDIERGSADGSPRENPVLEKSLDDAGDVVGTETHDDEEDSSVG
jgi:hypothetical protein